MIRHFLCLAGALALTALTTHSASAEWRFPIENLDPAVSPAQDFYDFAVGGWRQRNSTPPAYSRWGTFDALAQENQERIHVLLEEAAAAPAPEGTEQRKVGDFYASGMDEAAIEAAGARPIVPELERIERIELASGPDALLAALAHFQEIGVDAVFGFTRMPDPTRSEVNIAVADQGGLGLPDPSYYVPTDAPSRALLEAYEAHLAALLELAGQPADAARRDAAASLRIETALAAASMSRVERRDPYAVYNLLDGAGLAALTPHLA